MRPICAPDPFQGRTRPHAFSWVVWATTTFLAFVAQMAEGGGMGAWPIGLSGLISAAMAILAYVKRGDASITRGDWLFLGGAFLALPVWALTSDALWAVVILTTVDLLGFGPSFMKAWRRPHEDRIYFYAVMAARNALSILALENRSLSTVLFPGAVGLFCLVYVVLVWRRRAVLVEA
ncbi:MAG: hypothetical protein R3C52_08955 [Hyphomonadaceae bacterium]